jgi:hypothetical protein
MQVWTQPQRSGDAIAPNSPSKLVIDSALIGEISDVVTTTTTSAVQLSISLEANNESAQA